MDCYHLDRYHLTAVSRVAGAKCAVAEPAAVSTVRSLPTKVAKPDAAIRGLLTSP